jgi:hypothetical protein
MVRRRPFNLKEPIMSLLVSKVPRALETKTRLFGFELGDLLFVFLYLAISNLIFGQTRLKLPMVWIGTLSLAGSLYFVKRGKPENYIQHAGEHFWSPGVLSAGAADLEYRPYPQIVRAGSEVG